MSNATQKAPQNFVPMILAIGAFSFVVGGALTYQVVKLTTPSAPVVQAQAPEQDQMISDTLSAADVTRAATPSLASLSTESNAADTVESVVAEITKPQKLTEAERAAKAQEAIDIVNRNKLRMLKEGVVAGLYTVTADDENRLSLNSRNAPSAVTELKGLITAAAAQGTLKVPEGLGTSSGDVDSTTLLFEVVQQSLEAGSEDEQNAARNLRRAAFEASIAKTTVVNGARYYTVEPGDSLAYISLQFYGSPSSFNQIFEANKDSLSSPDKIFIGQKLRIPSV